MLAIEKISIPLLGPLLFIIFASVVCSCAQSWNVFLIVVKKVCHKYEEDEPQLCASLLISFQQKEERFFA